MTTRPLTVALLALLAIPSAAYSQQQDDDYYWYFDEKVTLDVEPVGFAVFDRVDADSDAAKEIQFDADQVAGTTLTRTALGDGWAVFSEGPLRPLLSTPNASSPPRDISFSAARRATAALAGRAARDHGARYLAAPIYRTKNNLALVRDRIIVSFNDDVPLSVAESVIESAGGSIVEYDLAEMEGTHVVELGGTDGMEALRASNRLHLHPEVQWSEPSVIWIGNHDSACQTRPSTPPTDNYFQNQWGLEQTAPPNYPGGFDLDALSAWPICSGDPAIKVAIIDDGVEWGHPDLNQVRGRNFVSTGPGGDPLSFGEPLTDCDNHGTTVAGVISALVDGTGTVGIAPDVVVISARAHEQSIAAGIPGVCDIDRTAVEWAVNAIEWAVGTEGARVVNHSYNLDENAMHSQALKNKYDDVRNNHDVIAFASTGNVNAPGIDFPANYGSVNAIGAADSAGNRWIGPSGTGSSFGTGIFMSGPGRDIWTTDRTGPTAANGGFDINSDYVMRTGTSYAAPYAAGVAALVLSLDPSLKPSDVENYLKNNAIDMTQGTGTGPGYDDRTGHGLVNAEMALQAVAADLSSIFRDDFESCCLTLWSGVVQ